MRRVWRTEGEAGMIVGTERFRREAAEAMKTVEPEQEGGEG